jgi:hypothetical protein
MAWNRASRSVAEKPIRALSAVIPPRRKRFSGRSPPEHPEGICPEKPRQRWSGSVLLECLVGGRIAEWEAIPGCGG